MLTVPDLEKQTAHLPHLHRFEEISAWVHANPELNSFYHSIIRRAAIRKTEGRNVVPRHHPHPTTSVERIERNDLWNMFNFNPMSMLKLKES